jgi:hypothetical protein
MQLPFEMLPGRHWWLIVTATSPTLHGKKIAIFLIIGAARPPTTSLLHLGGENFRLRPTLVSLSQTNTDLDQTSDELDAMRKAYLELAVENAMLKQQGGPIEDILIIPA